jgi:hypothetical protein
VLLHLAFSISVASLINYSDQSTEMIEIEQFRQKIEQFTLSKHGDVEIEMRCDKLKRLNEEAQSVVNKVKFNRTSGRSGSQRMLNKYSAISLNSSLCANASRRNVSPIDSFGQKTEASDLNSLNFLLASITSSPDAFVMISAERMTDQFIDSMRKEYVGVMGSSVYSNLDDNLELSSFWSMKDNDKFKEVQKNKLFMIDHYN